MSKIAPVTMALLTDLRAWVKMGKAGAGDAQVLRIVEAEVKALLSVVRAADRLVNVDRTRHPGTLSGSWSEAVDKTQRALARLSRAGKRGGR